VSFGEAVGYTLLLFVVFLTLGVLTSRTAIDRLVGIGMLPRAFANLVPALTLAARALAIALILIGFLTLGLNAGWFSRQWMEHYGFATLLIVLGVVSLLITFRGKRGG